MIIKQRNSINGVYSVPGDKSISHRAILLSILQDGRTDIDGICTGDDCYSTISCINQLGVETIYDSQNDRLTVFGKGQAGLEKPEKPLDCGNSGTTMRLLSGILAARPFDSVLTGDDSLKKRPMKRIIKPLEMMGAKIVSDNGFAPLVISGTQELLAIKYNTEISSAQVKSCILLAGLFANGDTVVTEASKSRDHTEILLKYLGASIKIERNSVTVTGRNNFNQMPIIVPGDFSSAAFLIAAALILKESKVIITHVCVNLTRTGLISVLRDMGAHIEVINRRKLCGEYVADIVAYSSELTGTVVSGDIIPRLIDELPILAVIALFAKGVTVIKDASELKVKESNRILTVVKELKKLGACIEATDDGMVIEGGLKLNGARVDSHNDHRIAMSLAIAGLCTNGDLQIDNGDCVSVSFREFYELING